ncbi:MAG TPA: decaprenyl-phosphate phosphoribosyltransferase [Thermomicrobiales bacterium]|nr:decaprenyl-phosphate phosphoribosyltransferase [Thermomicrobiales bacterium]
MGDSRVGTAARVNSLVRASLLRPWIRLIRPVQWSKNAIVFAGVVFARMATDPGELAKAILAFIMFCAISSAIYIFNDWQDIERDRHHPTKRARPLASGAIQPRPALTVSILLAILGIAISVTVSWWLLLVCLGYLVMQVAYTLELKNVVILDVFIIAAGFILRAVAGAVAVDVPVSSWLLLCTFFLSLFLGFCKRRNEMHMLDDSAHAHRPSLKGYSIPVLDQFIGLSAAVTLLSYSMYTFVSTYVPSNDAMMLTIPFVAFAISRYLYLVYGRNLGGSPEVQLFRDLPLFFSIVAWGICVLGVLAFQ